MQPRSLRSILLATAAAAAGLALVATSGDSAGAAAVSQVLDCGIGGNQTATIDVSAPATIAQGETYRVVIGPSGPAGVASGAEIKNMVTSFTAPAGSTPVPGSAKVVAGTGSGTLGAVSTTLSGQTIQLKVPGPIANGASFVNPSLQFDLQATGAVGTVLAVKFRSSAAYTLTAAGSFNVSCNAKAPVQTLASTTITGGTTTSTTTGGSSSTTSSTTTSTTALTTTSTTQPTPVTTYVDWSPTGGCGTVQSTTAPANTQSVTVTAVGAGGGRSGTQSAGTVAGGAGSSTVATFTATPGQTYSAVVGCAGADGGSFANTATPDGYSQGGGTGRGSIIAGQAGASGGSGGGSSAACLGATCQAGTGATPLVVAGGGGGGGVTNCSGTSSGPGGKGGGGSSTADATGAGNSGSNGGSGNGAGGAGGVNSSGGSADGGSNGNGSGGAGINVVGGGGGGGYVGGGQGGNASTGCKGGGGGGGGSSWAKATATNPSFGTASGAAAVTITFKTVVTPTPCPSDHAPFPSAEALVFQQYKDLKGGATPTIAQQNLWIGGINRCEQSADELITSLLPTAQTLDDARLVRLYLAYFKRPPDPSGFAYWQKQLDAGKGLINAAKKFAESTEFTRTYGSLSNGAFIDLVYQNVLERAPDATGRAFWLTRLDNKTKNRGDVMVNFSESTENQRTKNDHVQVFRLFRSMRQRFPTKTEFSSLMDPITNSGKTTNDAANAIRNSAGYAARF